MSDIKQNKNICGYFFEQKHLQKSSKKFQNVVAGQLLIFKFIVITIGYILSILSGVIAGLWGGAFGFNITAPARDSWLSFLAMAFVTSVWIYISINKGITKGFLYACTAVIGVTIIVIFLVFTGESIENIQIGVTPLLSLIGLGITFFSFISQCLSFGFIKVIISRHQRIFIIIYVKLTIFSALVSAHLALFYKIIVNEAYLEKTLPSNIESVVVSGGVIFSICMVVVSLIATKLSNKYQSSFEFLRNWAIAVGSWGGTSFYNLDLSRVDFTGAKLPNTDLRARKLYRTCFQGVTGLERSRVDNRYLDLTNPKVQKLLTHGCSEDTEFSRINLQGAYLRNADMRDFKLIETNLNGADLQGADLRRGILVRTQVQGVDFTGANLTGICIQDWSVNSKTCFAKVECDYIYRKLDDQGEPTERYPVGRNFEPEEFESLFQEVENVVELVFKEGVNWRALSFTFRKFQLEDEGLGLELKGVEQRGDLWVVKVTHKEGIPRQEVEQRVSVIYDDLKSLIVAKEQQFDKLLNIAAAQAEALKESSKRASFGNSFFIVGSTITNLAGSGQIDYDEASSTIRTIVANGAAPAQVTTIVQNLLEQFQRHSVATSADQQAELIQQVILTEAKKDPIFKQFFIQQGQQIADGMPESAIATAIREAFSQLD